MSAFLRQLVHSCTIQQPAKNRTNIGEVVGAPWVDYLIGIACRLVVKEQKIGNEQTGFIRITTYTLLVPTGTDVKAGFRVVNIVTESGTEVDSFNVESVLSRRGPKGAHHISLKLEKIK